MRIFTAAALIVFSGATGAAAQSCGPDVHTIYIEPRAFFPDAMYFCNGQSIKIENRSSSDIVVYYTAANGAATASQKISRYSTSAALQNPGNGTLTAKSVTESQRCVSYSYWGGCSRYEMQTNYSDLYSSGVNTKLIIGMAPDRY